MSSPQERHYSLKELAARWGTSHEFVRRLVRDEPGVLEFVKQARGRRRHITRRVPESVVQRIERRVRKE